MAMMPHRALTPHGRGSAIKDPQRQMAACKTEQQQRASSYCGAHGHSDDTRPFYYAPLFGMARVLISDLVGCFAVSAVFIRGVRHWRNGAAAALGAVLPQYSRYWRGIRHLIPRCCPSPACRYSALPSLWPSSTDVGSQQCNLRCLVATQLFPCAAVQS